MRQVFRCGGVVFCGVLLVLCGSSGAGTYRPIDLTPPGEQAALQSGGGGKAGGIVFVGNRWQARLWDVADRSHVTLHAPPWELTDVFAISPDGRQQAGSATDYDRPLAEGQSRAVIWSGSAGSLVDLHPPGLTHSAVLGTDGVQQVGQATFSATSTNEQPALWEGTAASVVDLTPTLLGYQNGQANAAAGGRQVGSVWANGSDNSVAVIWRGTPGSVIRLHPSGDPFYQSSEARDIAGDQQVGWAGQPHFFNPHHAILWRGSADSAVDLHPAGAVSSEAFATNGLQQVGWARGLAGDPSRHAFVWDGTAGSALDLHFLLGPDFVSSEAHDIDPAGYIYGTATDAQQRSHAIVWEPVPEPSSVATLGALAAAALMRRRRSRPDVRLISA